MPLNKETKSNQTGSFSHFSRTLGTAKIANYNWYHYLLHVPSAFSALWQDPSICLSFYFFSFSLNGAIEQQNLLDDKFFSSC